PRHARPWALRGAPDPSLQENPRVALIVLEAHGPLRAPRLGQAAREIDVAFVHVAVGVHDEDPIEIVHDALLTPRECDPSTTALRASVDHHAVQGGRSHATVRIGDATSRSTVEP